MTNGNIENWWNYPTNVTGIGNLVQNINYQINGYLGYGFLTIIFLFTFGLTLVSGSRKALLTSSFITFLFSIYFLRMGMINPVVSILLIVLTIIGALGSKSESSY